MSNPGRSWDDRMVFAIGDIETPIGRVWIGPGGVAHHPWRIGELRKGVPISTPHMSDSEIAEAGLTGIVAPASEEANRLHGKKELRNE
jgi:hypothetical protein